MQCKKCGYSFGDYKDKFCGNCGACIKPAKFKTHEKVVLGIGLGVALLTGAGVFGILYILYGILVWSVFT